MAIPSMVENEIIRHLQLKRLRWIKRSLLRTPASSRIAADFYLSFIVISQCK
jgi:hypothetical protein